MSVTVTGCRRVVPDAEGPTRAPAACRRGRGRPRSSVCGGSGGRPTAVSVMGQLPASWSCQTWSVAWACGASDGSLEGEGPDPAGVRAPAPVVRDAVTGEEDDEDRQRGGEEEHRPRLRGPPCACERVIPRVGPSSSFGAQLRRRARLEEHVVRALQPLPFGAGRVGADEFVQVPVAVHYSSPSSIDARRARALRVRVFTVPSGRWRYSATSLCDMPLQYASSITSRSRGWSSSRARCTRHATSESSARCAGPGSADASSGSSASKAGSVAAQPVDDRVPGDRVQPAAGRAAFRPVRRGGAPDRRERLLDGVLGVATVPEPAQREAEDRPDVAAVEDLEGLAVALADARQQLRVGRRVVDWLLHGFRGDGAQAGLGHLDCKFHIAFVFTHPSLAPDCSTRSRALRNPS